MLMFAILQCEKVGIAGAVIFFLMTEVDVLHFVTVTHSYACCVAFIRRSLSSSNSWKSLILSEILKLKSLLFSVVCSCGMNGTAAVELLHSCVFSSCFSFRNFALYSS